jgi:hypothetical protein
LNNGLKAKIAFEISQIDKLLNDSKPLLDLCKLKVPDFIEISAAALVLHSFYNGIENILVLIFKYYDEQLPKFCGSFPKLFYRTPELFRRTPELFHRTPKLFRRTPELFHRTPKLF